MSNTRKHVPKHRAPGRHKAVRRSTVIVRRAALASGVAAVATGVAVGGGVLDGASTTPVAADISASSATADTAARQAAAQTALEQRGASAVVSRSDRRGTTDRVKAAALDMGVGVAVTRSEDLSSGDPREIAKVLLTEYGFSADQFSCLDALYVGESNWRVNADNPTSSAYGIPQALTQLHDLPADYMTSAESQIRWGLDYIKGRYGTPCNAQSFKLGHGFY